VKSKITNPFKKTGTLKKIDEKHFEETNRGRKIVQEQLGENNNFLYNVSNCNSTDNWIKH